MTCHYRNNDSNALLVCMGLTPIYSDSDIMTYATRVGSERPVYVYNYVLSCLRVNRLIRPDIPEGPCGQFRAVATVEQRLFAGATKAGLNDPEPISSAILQGIGKLGSFFSNLFSGAPSLKELQTQCSVISSYNTYAAQAESDIACGKLGLQDAIVNLKLAQKQLQAALTSVMGGSDSAPYSISHALNALVLLNIEVVYPGMAPHSVLGLNGIKLGSGNTALYVGGGLVAAKLFGVI